MNEKIKYAVKLVVVKQELIGNPNENCCWVDKEEISASLLESYDNNYDAELMVSYIESNIDLTIYKKIL